MATRAVQILQAEIDRLTTEHRNLTADGNWVFAPQAEAVQADIDALQSAIDSLGGQDADDDTDVDAPRPAAPGDARPVSEDAPHTTPVLDEALQGTDAAANATVGSDTTTEDLPAGFTTGDADADGDRA